MRFNRLQIILTFLCLVTLGLSVGFLIKGSPTVMPFFLLVFLIALGVTFIPGIGNTWIHIRNGASPHVSNFGREISRDARSLGQSIWTDVKQGATHANPHVRSFFNGIGNNTKAFFGSVGNVMQRDSSLWFGIGCTLVATGLFAHAYVNGSYGKTFHFGLFAIVSAAIFFINHLGWDKAYDFIAERKRGAFLVVSTVWLLLAYEHRWPLLWPGVFTAVSAIIFFGWAPSIKEKGIEGARYLGNATFKLLTGGYGWGISCLAYAVIAFAWGAPLFQKPGILTGKELDLAYNLAMIIAILAILAPILIGEKVFKKKKDEER